MTLLRWACLDCPTVLKASTIPLFTDAVREHLRQCPASRLP